LALIISDGISVLVRYHDSITNEQSKTSVSHSPLDQQQRTIDTRNKMVTKSKTLQYSAVPQHDLMKEATSGSKDNEHRPIATTSTATIDDSVTKPGGRREREEDVESGSYPPNSIHYISIGLNPTILPLTYDPHFHTKTRKHGYCYYLCRCRVVVSSIILILLMTLLIHWLIWLILKKDQEVSLLVFILREG
jgi:hypothetical protein